jgi:Putative beta-barrel porin-2, OmpL-like. bbp2
MIRMLRKPLGVCLLVSALVFPAFLSGQSIGAGSSQEHRTEPMTKRERELRDRMDKLEQRLAALATRSNPASASPEAASPSTAQSWNNFTLNQAVATIERAPDPDNDRRFGYRLDLMFGQGTEILQGSTANEPRPQVYRNIYQAYGSYVLPIGSGFEVDFGRSLRSPLRLPSRTGAACSAESPRI